MTSAAIATTLRAGASLEKRPFPPKGIHPPGVDRILGPLLVQLTAQPCYQLGSPMTLQFKLQNVSKHIYRVLTWATPLEGELLGNCFTVLRDGDVIAYDGKLASRPDPLANEYVTIHPGQVLTATVDLSTYYAIEDAGEFTATFSGVIFDAFTVPSGAATTVHPRSEFQRIMPLCGIAQFRTVQYRAPLLTLGQKHRISVAKKLRDLESAVVTGGGAGGGMPSPELTGFTPQQQQQILLAHDTALFYALQARDQLAKVRAETNQLYQYWFGEFDQARYDCVKSHYAEIATKLQTHQVAYEYDANTTANAYAIPEFAGVEWHTVWLGPAFFSGLANSGLDSSRFGVLVHEWSHALCSTNDYYYGAESDHALAVLDPGDAIDGADNHQLFVEALEESGYGRCLSIVLERPEVGSDEVQQLLEGSSNVRPPRLVVVVNDCWPSLLGISVADPGNAPCVKPRFSIAPSVPGMGVKVNELTISNGPLRETPMDFLWHCELDFTSADGFPSAVGQVKLVTITATVGSFSASATVGLRHDTPLPDLASLVMPGQAIAGDAVSGTVTLTGPAPEDVVVDLSSDDDVASVPQTVTVHAWDDHANFTISTLELEPQKPSIHTARISARLGHIGKTRRLVVRSYGNAPVP